MKSYPYIGVCNVGFGLSSVALFADKNKGALLKRSSSSSKLYVFTCDYEESSFQNITTEYLANTYGEVKSKEHAEFIVKLAETANCAGLEVAKHKIASTESFRGIYFNFYTDNETLLFAFHHESQAKNRGEKQITIPLPPECESADEWPKVGGDVLIHDLGFERNTKGTYKGENKNGVPIIELDDGSVFLLGFGGSISKPKTPEQALRDELISAMDDSNTAFQYAEHLAKEIINGEIEGLEYKPQ